MNNELKILITASTAAAKKAIKEVKDEIEKVDKSAKKNGKSISDSMKAIAKGAAIAVGAIAAVTTALVAFGKSTMEAQKNIAKLNAAFQSAGGTTKQAGETYKNLYRFMGDSGAATEAAQNLARITTNTKDLAEWTKILQGVYARAGDAIPIESLSEAANETINVGKVTGAMADALNWVGVSEDAFNSKLAQTTSLSEREALVRSTLNGLYMNASNIYERNNSALLANAESQARLDMALAQAGSAILPLMTSVNNLAASLLTTLSPAIAVVSQMIAILVGWISTAVKWISSFFSLFSGGKGSTKEVANDVSKVGSGAKSAAGGVGGLNKALGSAAKAAKELKKQTMGFDELNVMQSQDTSSSGGGAAGGGGGSVAMPDMSGITDMLPDMSSFTEGLEEARAKAEAILTLVGAVALGFGLWKLANFISEADNAQKIVEILKGKIQTISGVILIVAGTVLLVKGYMDAWVNGIDWDNFAAILGGLTLIIGGLALAFGPVAAGIGALAGGVALVVLGIKDFIENGYSMENVLTILAGVIAIVVGVCLAFNAALLANPITWIIIAIAALVAAFVILWNECEGFRNFWIAVWEKVKEGFAAFVDSIQPLIDALVNAFTAAWELIKVIWNDYLVPLFQWAWEAIKVVWDAVKPYFEAIWEAIKAVFSVVADVLGSFFSTAWDAIKVVWDVVVGYFSAIWDTIAGIFSVVKDVLTGNWQGAWDGIKGIVNTWIDFFKGVWNGIKQVFSSVASFFKDIFSKAWQGVLAVFSATGQVFKGIAEGILEVFKTVVNFIIDGINKVVKLPFEGLNKILDKIHGIKIVGVKPFGWLTWRAPVPQLPKLAKGGIVDSTTIAMIGEAGKEAVIPLENNTEWMDKLANKITAKNGNPTKIILKVGEKELGWATIDAINGITEQTGGLQLAL